MEQIFFTLKLTAKQLEAAQQALDQFVENGRDMEGEDPKLDLQVEAAEEILEALNSHVAGI